MSWTLSGTYMEACNCKSACPCIFMSDPTEGECTALVGWHIDRGQFHGTRLDGLNVALALHSPGNMVEVEWKVALYLDDRADDAQKDALGKIFSGQVGGHPAVLCEHVGEVLGVSSAEVRYEQDGDRKTLHVGDVGVAEIETFFGQNGDPVTVSNHPVAVAPGFPAELASSVRLKYVDHGYSWEISDRGAIFAKFEYQGP